MTENLEKYLTRIKTLYNPGLQAESFDSVS